MYPWPEKVSDKMLAPTEIIGRRMIMSHQIFVGSILVFMESLHFDFFSRPAYGYRSSCPAIDAFQSFDGDARLSQEVMR
jgi:hypothetical protein